MNDKLLLPEGIYRDRHYHADGTVKDYGWRSNIIVDRCRQLLAAFMQGDGDVDPGIQLISFGRGQAAWDTEVQPEPQAGTEQLVDPLPETIPVTDAAMALAYLDAAGASTAGPTHRVQVTVTLAPGTLPIAAGESSFPLREFGLFGRYDSQDFMIDYVRHPVIAIGAADTLVRTVRLLF